ncbi:MULTISPECIES: DNA-directed RNA polymerase subunit beta [unclassified Salinicoccus]|uniref:DNA-directed RNA polymerase subunit beta n=1 Tax=Salinicoccus bachuensis TaxID=3136731 RepID=A0ABZ3CI10_9STAP|nr:DNA-directed RNA polymerase subunit beta [Salinicoccus sp. RF5]MCC4723152.1 DNA-directed RNA polymerase subunit beta [Salinicoccus sp. RF5]
MAEQSKKLVHRRFPLIIRILLFIYIAIIVFFGGLMIGYGILDNPMEVFRIETWEHIINMTKE